MTSSGHSREQLHADFSHRSKREIVFSHLSVCVSVMSLTQMRQSGKSLIFRPVILAKSAAECDRVGLSSSSLNIWEQDAHHMSHVFTPVAYSIPFFSPYSSFYCLLSSTCAHCSAAPLAGNCSRLFVPTYRK